jgi:hypothetical protein
MNSSTKDAIEERRRQEPEESDEVVDEEPQEYDHTESFVVADATLDKTFAGHSASFLESGIVDGTINLSEDATYSAVMKNLVRSVIDSGNKTALIIKIMLLQFHTLADYESWIKDDVTSRGNLKFNKIKKIITEYLLPEQLELLNTGNEDISGIDFEKRKYLLRKLLKTAKTVHNGIVNYFPVASMSTRHTNTTSILIPSTMAYGGTRKRHRKSYTASEEVDEEMDVEIPDVSVDIPADVLVNVPVTPSEVVDIAAAAVTLHDMNMHPPTPTPTPPSTQSSDAPVEYLDLHVKIANTEDAIKAAFNDFLTAFVDLVKIPITTKLANDLKSNLEQKLFPVSTEVTELPSSSASSSTSTTSPWNVGVNSNASRGGKKRTKKFKKLRN